MSVDKVRYIEFICGGAVLTPKLFSSNEMCDLKVKAFTFSYKLGGSKFSCPEITDFLSNLEKVSLLDTCLFMIYA